ncbi:hypothetical protein ACP70R_018800 [Stipagrostis hirtigluma subsp. patula]
MKAQTRMDNYLTGLQKKHPNQQRSLDGEGTYSSHAGSHPDDNIRGNNDGGSGGGGDGGSGGGGDGNSGSGGCCTTSSNASE